MTATPHFCGYLISLWLAQPVNNRLGLSEALYSLLNTSISKVTTAIQLLQLTSLIGIQECACALLWDVMVNIDHNNNV